MKTRGWRLLLASVAMALLLVPAAAFATESGNGRTIDFGTFLEEVKAAGYNYDGQGVTVEWSPSSACTDNRGAGNHACRFEGEAPLPDGNNPQRGQGNNAQYQIFAGEGDVSIANVNFKFVPGDFTLCMNSGWSGAFSQTTVRNAELQLNNTGNVALTGCSFDGVMVSPYASTANLTVSDCSFSNVFNGYALKDIHSLNATIAGNTFDNCGGGIYFEGAGQRGNIAITNNTFINVDGFAAEGKEFTRGLVQFSAGSGDYSNASIDISGNTSTGGAGAIRQLNNTVTESVLALDAVMANNTFDGPQLTDSSFGENTVYYNGSYYKTMTDALKGVYMSTPADVAKVYCKANADLGAMTHGHVADDLVIYGNGAFISGGERDLEIDTYKYSRTTGTQDKVNGAFLEKDITVTVKGLNGIAAWGQRNTDHEINLVFENCQDMQRVYFSASDGNNSPINVTLDGCSFDGTDDGNLVANRNTTIYSNAPGEIVVKNTTFKNIAVGLNMNNKSAGTQNITIEGCEFIDCATTDNKAAADTKTYGAPVRVLAQEGATSNLVINGTTFTLSEGKESVGNGDILLGDGRAGKNAAGTVTLGMTDTDATVCVQQTDYYDASGNVADPSKSVTTNVAATDTVLPDSDLHFVIDDHSITEVVGAKAATCTEEGYTGDTVCAKCGKVVKQGEVIAELGHQTEIVGAKDATCTAEGYTGDKVCSICGAVVEQGEPTSKLSHDFVDGKCTACGATDPNYVAPSEPKDEPKDEPGDESEDEKTEAAGEDSVLAKTSDGIALLAGAFSLIVCAAGGIALIAARARKA